MDEIMLRNNENKKVISFTLVLEEVEPVDWHISEFSRLLRRTICCHP